MKRIAVVHPDIRLNGGGEAVCAHMLDALCDGYEVTLVTWAPPDLGLLDSLYSTELVNKRLAVVAVGQTCRLPNLLAKRSVIKYAIAVRHVQDHLEDFDAVVSTWCEIAVNKPAVQYIHVPLFLPGVDHEVLSGEPTSKLQVLLWGFLRAFARRLARGSRAGYRRSLSVANSAWTADLVRDLLHVEPVLIWPPIPKVELRSKPWSERQDGFVCVGRLVRGKRILEMIDCLEKVHAVWPALKLHIVGSGQGAYADAVRERCKHSDFAIYEGRLSNDELFQLLGENKYGMHGFPHEHFGIALAQMVMAGCLCFAPAGGGQAELLANNAELLYEDFDDATNKILRMLEDTSRQEIAREALEPVREALDQHDFQESMRRVLEMELSKTDAEPDPVSAVPVLHSQSAV